MPEAGIPGHYFQNDASIYENLVEDVVDYGDLTGTRVTRVYHKAIEHLIKPDDEMPEGLWKEVADDLDNQIREELKNEHHDQE